jgi:hypothetical protein
MRGCKVIVVPVRDNKQFAAYIDNYQTNRCNNDPLDTRQSIIAMAVANYSSKLGLNQQLILCNNNKYKH